MTIPTITNPYINRTQSIPANSILPIAILARFFTILSNNQPKNIQISFDNGATLSDLPAGVSIDLGLPTDQIMLNNPNSSTAIVTFAMSNGVIQDHRTAILSDVKTYGSDTIATPANVGLTNGSNTQIVAASTSDTFRIVQNIGTDDCWIGDATVTQNTGIRLLKGGGVIGIPSRAAIFGIANASSTIVTVMTGA